MNKRVVRDVPMAAADTVVASGPSPRVVDAAAPSETGNSTVADRVPQLAVQARRVRRAPAAMPVKRFAAVHMDEHASNRQAELFYLQKQIQQQTQMVLILEDGSRLQGVIEWYDRNCIKLRGKSRVLVNKWAIKYLYKAGEAGSGQE